MSATWQLESVGAAWDDLDTDRWRQLRWFWCDLAGQHLDETFPDDLPVTTHLWGWGADRWARLRLDGDRVVGAVLHAVTTPVPDGAPATVVRQSHPADQRLPAVPAPPPPSVQVVTIECYEPVRLTFVELRSLG